MNSTTKRSSKTAPADARPVKARDASHSGEAKPVLILLIEDSPSDAKLFERCLGQSKDADRYWLVHVKRLAKAVRLLERSHFDLVVLDLCLPDSNGLDSLRSVQGIAPTVPVVVLTGSQDEKLCDQALEEGAQDYLQKGTLDGNFLSRVFEFAIERQKHVEKSRIVSHISGGTEVDPITGLHLAAPFGHRLRYGIAQAHRTGKCLGVILADVETEHLKSNSEIYNFAMQAMSQRFQDVLRENDYLARIDDSIFGFVLQDVDGGTGLGVVAERLLTVTGIPITWKDLTIPLRCRFGISLYPQDGNNLEQMISSADLALSAAKTNSESIYYSFFDTQLNLETQERKLLQEGLVEALNSGRFELYYQPCFDLQGDALKEVQTLARVRKHDGSEMSSTELFSTAEKAHLLPRINRWIFETSCRQAARWKRKGMNVPGLTFQLSHLQFSDSSFIRFVKRILSETGIAAEDIAFQIAKSELDGPDKNRETFITEIKSLGAKLILDQVGNSLSNLDELRKYAFDQINLSSNTIREIDGGKGDLKSIGILIEMAHKLDAVAMAKSIETEEQFDRLKLAGCDLGQGPFLSEELTAKQVEDVLWKNSENNPLHFIT